MQKEAGVDRGGNRKSPPFFTGTAALATAFTPVLATQAKASSFRSRKTEPNSTACVFKIPSAWARLTRSVRLARLLGATSSQYVELRCIY